MIKNEKWLHIIAEFSNYRSSFGIIIDDIKLFFSNIIKKVWLMELWNYYYEFWKDAYTWVICLAESHISIHTWPESKYLTLDIYVCNYEKDNSSKAKEIFNELKNFYNPEIIKVQYIIR